MADLLKAALEYADRGWPVFPCRVQDKRPASSHGFKDATLDPSAIKSWWASAPYNIGIPCGPLTFDGIDIDGEQGRKSYDLIVMAHGPFPSGPRQTTPHGLHILVRGGTLPVTSRRIKGIDTRGLGGYLVMAPSVTPDGIYVLEGGDLALPDPPDHFMSKLDGVSLTGDLESYSPGIQYGEPALVDEASDRMVLRMAEVELRYISEGARNDGLFRIGASLRARGQELGDIRSVLEIANRHLCVPPLTSQEVDAISRSAASYKVSRAYLRAAEAARQEAKQQIEVKREVARAEKADPETARRIIEQRAGIRVERVLQVGRDSPSYSLDLGGGQIIAVGPSIMSQRTLAEVLVRHRQHIGFKQVTAKEWPIVLQALVRLIDVADQPETERAPSTMEWVRLYRLQYADRSLQKTYEVVKRGEPFEEDGRFHLNVPAFTRYVAKVIWSQVSPPDMVARLKEAGFSQAATGRVSASSPDGDTVQARYWSIPAEWLLA